MKSVLTAVLMLLPFVATAHEAYRYIDPVFPAKRLTINVTDAVFLFADNSEKMTACGNRDRFICVNADGFSFAVPRAMYSGQVEWKYKDRIFRVESSADYAVLGRTMRLMRIRQDDPEMRHYYLYSREVGLVAVVRLDLRSGVYASYLLEGRCGFGAAIRCE